MKRLTLFFSMLITASLLNAQTSKEINFEQYTKKVEKSDAEIQDPKKNVKDAVWISRGELMMDIYDAQILRAYVGMDTNSFMLVVGKPMQKELIHEEGTLVKKYVMERVNFYFTDGKLDRWEVTKPVIEKPLDIALESFKKAIEIDAAGKRAKKLKENLVRLKGLYINEGSNAYTFKNYALAFEHFKKVIEISNLPILNHKDTAIYYYAGLSAQLAGLNAECIPYYEKAIELGFTSEGSAYYNLYDAYKSLGRLEEGAKMLEQGFIKFPKNTNILFSLISYYIDKQDDPTKIIVYIDKAIESEPNNATLYFAKGTLFDRLGDFDNSFAAYQKAVELDPKFFDAYYNIGALFFNKGVKYLEEANKVPAKELDKYDALMEKANQEFKKALPHMERAYEVNPNSREVIEALKNIYFRFRKENSEYDTKFQEFNQKLKEM